MSAPLDRGASRLVATVARQASCASEGRQEKWRVPALRRLRQGREEREADAGCSGEETVIVGPVAVLTARAPPPVAGAPAGGQAEARRLDGEGSPVPEAGSVAEQRVAGGAREPEVDQS